MPYEEISDEEYDELIRLERTEKMRKAREAVSQHADALASMSYRQIDARRGQYKPSPVALKRVLREIGMDYEALERTAKQEQREAVRPGVNDADRDHRHWSLRDQQQKLNTKLRGHYAYYGATGNSAALSRFLR